MVIGTETLHGGTRVDRTLRRLLNHRPRPIRSGLRAGLVVAADDRHVALLLGPREVATARPDGTVTARIALATPTVQPRLVYGAESRFGLANNRLVVVDGRRLDVYDARSGRLEESTPLVGGASSVSTAGGLVAYVMGREVHVRRLGDGGEFSVRVGGALATGVLRDLYIERLLHADLTTAGLVYSYNLRGRAEPGRVVFVPRAELERRLAG